jgi:hypothetical protein
MEGGALWSWQLLRFGKARTVQLDWDRVPFHISKAEPRAEETEGLKCIARGLRPEGKGTMPGQRTRRQV